jgi:hypothetical protein
VALPDMSGVPSTDCVGGFVLLRTESVGLGSGSLTVYASVAIVARCSCSCSHGDDIVRSRLAAAEETGDDKDLAAVSGGSCAP